MSNTGAVDRDQREHLKTIRALVRELDRAMLAISRNRLSELEDSVAEQEILTARLRGISGVVRDRNDMHNVALPIDSHLAKEVAAAHAELQQRNRVYEAVLRHSGHSASLMVSLLDSFRGNFSEASGSRLRHQTWSCQV